MEDKGNKEAAPMRLSDLNPPPKGGEWYSILYQKGNRQIRTVTVIDKFKPNLAILPTNTCTGIHNLVSSATKITTARIECKNPQLVKFPSSIRAQINTLIGPIKISTDEAKSYLQEAINNLQTEVDDAAEADKERLKISLENMQFFYNEHFAEKT